MWPRWSLRAKVVVVTVGVVLPVLALTTALTVRMSRAALEADIRDTGLALARGLAASAAAASGPAEERELQREIDGLIGKGSVARDAAIYARAPHGLAVRARGGDPHPPGAAEEIAARENQQVVGVRGDGRDRVLRLVVPVPGGGRSVGAVSLGLRLDRADALARRQTRQAIGIGAATVVLLVGSLVIFMNRALTAPIRRLVQVMRRAEQGDLGARSPVDRGDEVGQVAQGLNRMLERVGTFQAELARQVAEATAELRAANQRLYAARAQVARTQRLAAAGELAAALAHDVGTPLAAVSGHLQLLEEDVADPPVKERLRMIQGHVDRVAEAARHFLDAARPRPAHAPVDVNALLADLAILISPEAQRMGIAVTRSFAEDLPLVPADPGQVQELFLNLLTNALEAMGAGGTLGLVTEATRDRQGAPGVRVRVEDTGAGMGPQVLARAFEPFFTTHESSGGTGLGLGICRRIAADHGGALHLESAPGRGTRAIVELPARAT